MTDTPEGTSDAKLCTECGAAFDRDDDKRFSRCKNCRNTGTDTVADEGSVSPEPVTVDVVDPPVVQTMPDLDQGGYKPLKLDIEKHKPPPMEDRDFYWCGATEDCPASLTLGGFSFPKTIGRIVDRSDGMQELQENAADGEIHRMTDENVALVLQHAANKVIRNHQTETISSHDGKVYTRHTGMVKSKTGSRVAPYIPHETDRPIGEFVYMVKVRHGNDRPMSNPPTLVPRTE